MADASVVLDHSNSQIPEKKEELIEKFRKQAQEYRQELYDNLKPLEKLQIARHSNRPNFTDYLELITHDFVERTSNPRVIKTKDLAP